MTRKTPYLLFITAILFSLNPIARAELNMENTRGPGGYAQNTVNFDADVSRKVNIGVGYAQSSADDNPVAVNTYSAGIGVTAGKHGSVRGSVSHSPDANGGTSTGWGAGAAYGGGGGLFSWSAGLSCNQTSLSEYWESVTTIQHQNGKNAKTTTTVSSGWQNLLQTSLAPSFYADLFDDRVGLSCGYSAFFYDHDVAAYSDSLARISDGAAVTTRGNNVTSTSTDYGNLASVIDGFPSHVLSAGMAVRPLRRLRLGYDWSETAYALEKPPVYTSTFSAAYTFFSRVRARCAYSLLSNDETYVALGMAVVW